MLHVSQFTHSFEVSKNISKMIWALIGILMVAEAAKLDNAYLPPPPSAKESGGSEGALQVPLEPPYIDQYTPNEQIPETWRPGTRSLKKNTKNTKVPATHDNKFLENEDEITVPALEKGRFISGSYSYTGPDNVLVTVTYKADNRKGRKEDEEEDDVKDNKENDAEEESEEEVAEAQETEEEDDVSNDEEEQNDDDLIVPTPPSLPAELARAFDFHKSKHFGQEEKTIRTKKPIRKNHKNKGEKHGVHGSHGGHGAYGGYEGNHYGSANHASNNYEGQYGQKIPGHIHGHKQGVSGPAYQYPPPNQYGPPSITQGYSYPKAS